MKHKSPLKPFTVFAVWVLAFAAVSLASAAPGDLTRVSVASDGTQGDDISFSPALSEDGRLILFHSAASNLVPGDTNGVWDAFLHDRETGTTTRISQTADGTQGNGTSINPQISADTRFIAFQSEATNLVPGDTNGCYDIFVQDRQTGAITRVSVASDGTQGARASSSPTLSADGRFVAFYSPSDNLVLGDTNEDFDVFVHDRQTGETTRVSVASDGTQGNGISSHPILSADGRLVAFRSTASNLVPDDTNGWADIFVHDRETGETRRVSVASDGTQANSMANYITLSGDGRFVGFSSHASNLVPNDGNRIEDVFVHDRQTGITRRVSEASGEGGNAQSMAPSISPDGRFVAFRSMASNLVPGDTNGNNDIFLHDLKTGENTLPSSASDGSPGDLDAFYAAVSERGCFVAFTSYSTNLVPGDTNGTRDVFVRERLCCHEYFFPFFLAAD